MSGVRLAALVLGIAGIDQAVKAVVKLSLLPGEMRPIFGSVFRLTLVENNGFAFGLTLHDLAGSWAGTWSAVQAKYLLSVVSVLALGLLVYALWRYRDHRSALPWMLAIIIGGALGNVIDRTLYGWLFADRNLYQGSWLQGRVVDMFCFDPSPESFAAPVFNLADVAIAVGVFSLLFLQHRFHRQHKERLAAELSDDGKEG